MACRHPRDQRSPNPTGYDCLKCGRFVSKERSATGRRARQRAGDHERRIEKKYGPEKIGERGEKADHIGTLGKYQSKTTQAPIPAWLRVIDSMDGVYRDRIPVLVLTYSGPGRPSRDFFVIRGDDWLALHGRDENKEAA